MLVSWKCLVTSLDLLFLSMLSFVKTVKTILLSFSEMTWSFLYTCKAFAAQTVSIHVGRRSKYQSGEVFEEAFYFE